MKRTLLRFCFLLPALFFIAAVTCFSQDFAITNDLQKKKVTVANHKMKFVIDYKASASIPSWVLNKQEMLDTATGVYSMIRTKTSLYNTLHLSADPLVKIYGNKITVSNIVYGDKEFVIQETWHFAISKTSVNFSIDRVLSKPVMAEQAALPVFMFRDINTWEGAYQGYGGIAWFYLFNKKLDTYGVHTNSSRFWNSKTGNGLSVLVDAPGKEVAMTYTRTNDDKLCYSIVAADNEMIPRFDSATQRRRYIRDGVDVWSPSVIPAMRTTQSITLSYFDFNETYGRGNLKGINGQQVSAVLNTIARIGVIDKKHFGGNSWHTPYGPICLHEQYIAQMGLAINDTGYTNGYQQCLDYYRDNAIKPDGRVWARWAYSNEDMMPGEVTDKGFYEAQWGYLLDSNPDFVANVVQLYNQTGNKEWVRTHQSSCEKALDWIINRDFNNNGLVEMMTDSHKQRKGSDWLDIIWASYENAFVNAKLYHALVIWADVEGQLGNKEKQKQYTDFANKLKTSFNKPVTAGGFWDDDKKCYIHWRDKDGSLHGNNMVTPVNFMAIGYGICDDNERTKTILDKIEMQMQKEKLFFWPVCMDSYQPGEGNDWQFPFPNYENGDIFLSWGSLGVKACASYKPALAVKYVRNVLAQYEKDGLAFQRYGRTKQDGLGDDILSGNSLSVIGLYQAVYGINPLYNRFYLNPHITQELAGTKVKYNFRGQPLVIDLNMNSYTVSNGNFTISAATDFGFYNTGKVFSFFNGNSAAASLQITAATKGNIKLLVKKYSSDEIILMQSSADSKQSKLDYAVNQLVPKAEYTITVNGKILLPVTADTNGSAVFSYETGKQVNSIIIRKK